MEIEVGDFVRTNNGLLGRVNKIELKESGIRYAGEFMTDTIVQFNDGKVYERRVRNKDIVKHSKNIIDLLEEGDIVNGFSISKFDNEDGNEFLAIPIYNDAQLDCIEEVRPIATIKIKTILTHEQYMQNCYTVERKEEQK